MIWESTPLLAKAKLFNRRALNERADDALFGLWCSLSLELLARAVISSISPTLLSEPERDQRNLLHALGAGPALTAPKSIASTQVIALCQLLIPSFTKEDATAASALINRRNAELHTAEAAFATYPSKQWLPSFYRVCQSLTKHLDESLETFLGKDEAALAAEILKQSKESVLSKVASSIAAYKRVFGEKSPNEQSEAQQKAQQIVAKLVFEHHHKVLCPACGSDASVEGNPFGSEALAHESGEIVVRQSVEPRTFACPACGLKLTGYAELDAADLGGTYMRRSTFSPEDYYGLIDPETADMSEYVNDYLADMANEYNND